MRTIKRTSILRPCKYDWPPEIKGDGPFYAINPYVGCQHNCSYCWARDMTYRFRKQWGIPDDFEWDKPLVVVGDIIEEMDIKKLGIILFSNLTDAYQPLEEKVMQMPFLLNCLNVKGWHGVILTKARSLPLRDIRIIGQGNIKFGVTITEPQDYPRKRLLREMFLQRIPTFASVEPWIPPRDVKHIIWSIQPYADFWIIGSLNKNGRAVNPEFYKQELPPLIEWMDKEGIKYYIKKELRRATGM